MQTIIVIALVIAAAIFIVLRLRRALTKPSCLCDDPGACPFAGKTPPDGRNCPHPR